MPALENPQHEQFARLVAGGASKVEAFDQVFPGAVRRTARDQGALLAQRPEVEERIVDLLEDGADEAIWSLAERLEYLRAVALTPHAELNEKSPLCRGVHWTAEGPEYKMPDKLSAVALYSRLAGDFDRSAGPERNVICDMVSGIRTGSWAKKAAEKKQGHVLANSRHERFAQLVGSGERAAYAYEKVYGVPRAAARVEGYRLSHRPEVAARISEIRHAGASLVGWTRGLRLSYLRNLAETPFCDISEHSCYCQGRRRNRFGQDIRTPDKVRAIALYSKLAQIHQHRRGETIEDIVAEMREQGDLTAAESAEKSLICFVTDTIG